MSSFGAKALQVLRTVAPTIALAAGGPFGPLAAAAVHAALGTGGDDKAAETALLTATPDQLLALKKADSDLQVRLKELGIAEEKLTFDDMANARAMQVSTHDSTPKYLAYFVTFGFFATLGYLIMYGKPQAGGDVMLVMVGALGTAWASIVSFYYGSSAGSAANRDALNRIAVTK